jgi:hypothetical protein
VSAGIVLAIAALVLVSLGNPPNMGLCIACFERDIVGALGLHDFRQTAWLRLEIPAILLGGCPLRQLVLAGNGSADAAVAVLGMMAGTALAHNCNLVKAASPYGKEAVVACLCVAIVIGWINRDRQE